MIRFYRIDEGKWISQVLNNTEFNYYLVLELIDMHDVTGETQSPQYSATLSAVAPSQVSAVDIRTARECCGISHDTPLSQSEIAIVLHDYGIMAVCELQQGDNWQSIIRILKHQSLAVNGLFGLYMDRPQNRIGTTGWDMLRGDLLAPLQKGD